MSTVSSSWLLLQENLILKNIAFPSSRKSRSCTCLLFHGTTPPFTQRLWALVVLCKVPPLTPFSQLKRKGDAHSLDIFQTGISARFHPSSSFPSLFFFFLFTLFLLSLIFPNPDFKSVTLKTKNKRAIHLPSANTLTDAAYKPSCEVKQTCSISYQHPFSPSVWVSTLYYFALIASFCCEDQNSSDHNYPSV